MKREYHDTLPVFKVKRSTEYKEYVLVTCPYEDCASQKRGQSRPFMVHAKTWFHPLRRVSRLGNAFFVRGRSCPYCFRAARLPERSEVS